MNGFDFFDYINWEVLENAGISTANFKSSGMKVYQKMYIPFVASLSSLAFIAMSNIM